MPFHIDIVYLVLYLVVAFGALYESYDPYKPNYNLQNFTLFVFILITGLRIVGDTTGYRIVYYIFDNTELEKGYVWLTKLFKLFNCSFTVFLLFTAFITGVLIKKTFGDRWFFLGMLMILGKLATLYALSGLRQWIALCICFYGINLLLKGQKKSFIIAILIASLFHKSALVSLPMYFLYNQVFKYKIAFPIFMIACLIGFYSFSFFKSVGDINSLFNFGGYLAKGEESMNSLNWIENFAIFIPSLLFRNKIVKFVPHYDFFLYVHLVYTAFLIMGSDFGIIKRLRDYYVIGYYVLLPSFMYLFPIKYRKAFLVLVIFYFGLLFFRSLNVYTDVGHYKCILFDRLDIFNY